jgi:hypothetical protein
MPPKEVSKSANNGKGKGKAQSQAQASSSGSGTGSNQGPKKSMSAANKKPLKSSSSNKRKASEYEARQAGNKAAKVQEAPKTLEEIAAEKFRKRQERLEQVGNDLKHWVSVPRGGQAPKIEKNERDAVAKIPIHFTLTALEGQDQKTCFMEGWRVKRGLEVSTPELVFSKGEYQITIRSTTFALPNGNGVRPGNDVFSTRKYPADNDPAALRERIMIDNGINPLSEEAVQKMIELAQHENKDKSGLNHLTFNTSKDPKDSNQYEKGNFWWDARPSMKIRSLRALGSSLKTNMIGLTGSLGTLRSEQYYRGEFRGQDMANASWTGRDHCFHVLYKD